MKSVIRAMMGSPLWLRGIGAVTHVSLGRVTLMWWQMMFNSQIFFKKYINKHT